MSEKINVINFELDNIHGGIESFMINVLENINHEMFNCEYVTSYSNSDVVNRIKELGGIVHEIPSKKKIFSYIHAINKLLKNHYDIVHIHKNSGINIIPLILSNINKVKRIIFHSHNTDATVNTKLSFLHKVNRKYILSNSDILLACSEKAAKWMYGRTEGITIIKNGIKIDKFRFNQTVRDEVRLKLGLNNAYVVGHVGRFNRQKNHDFLIRIFNAIKEKNDNAILMLIGEGQFKNEIIRLVKSYGLEKSVLFLGVRSDVNELLQAMDAFVLPSLYEGLPIVCVEAQAAGLPCLVSDTVTSEVMITDKCKMKSLDNSPESWANEILSLNKTRGYDNNIEKYNIKNTVNVLEKIYHM